MASWWEVLAIIVGVILLAIEVFVIPGFGMLC
jgi:membrane-bound ClpP family serine protease